MVGLVLTAWAISAHLTIHNDGNVTQLRVFWDMACTNETKTIHWGILSPGSNCSYTIWLKNTGNNNYTHLNMTVANWNPSSCPGYMTITWDRENEMLSARSLLSTTLTITVFENITSSDPVIGDFANDIVIYAEYQGV
jgi:hypothetical protein